MKIVRRAVLAAVLPPIVLFFVVLAAWQAIVQ